MLASTNEMLFNYRLAPLQGTQGELGAGTKPGLVFSLQQESQSISYRSAQPRRDYRLDRMTAVHFRVLQDHVPEEALRSVTEVIWDPRIVELSRCVLDVFEPRLVNVRPLVAYRYPLVDD